MFLARRSYSLLGFLEGFLDRLFCLLGALIFVQVPEFIQQYLQRLGGHLDEARRQVQQYENVADGAGLSLQQFVQHIATNADTAVASMGKLVSGTLDRRDHLMAAESAIRNASVFSKPFVFLRHFDIQIARGTLDVFRPALPVTVEGIVYAMVGGLTAFLLYRLVATALRQAERALSDRSKVRPLTVSS